MIKSDLIHNKQTFKYIFFIALTFSLFLSAFVPFKQLFSGKYVLPVYITSPSISGMKIEAFNQHKSKINITEKNGSYLIFDQYIFKINISSVEPYSISTKDKMISLSIQKDTKDLVISSRFIPLNFSFGNFWIDLLKVFIFTLIKYFILFTLLVYLIVDRINYSTEINFRKNKLSITESLSFKEFIAYILISIGKLAKDIFKNKALMVALIMLSITNIPLTISVYLRQSNLDIPLFVLHSLHKLFFDPLFYALVFAVLLKFLRFKIIPIGILVLGIFMNLADAAVYYFGFTVAERNHATLITPYSVLGFLSPQLVILFAILIISLIPVNYYLFKGLKKTNINKLAVLVLFAYFVNLPSIIFPIYSLFNEYKPGEISIVEKNDDLYYSHENSLINFFAEMFYFPIFNKPMNMDIKKFKEVAEYYNIPFGKRNRGLNIPKPEKIVMVASESLTLDLISAHNPSIKPDNSGIWGLDEMFNKTATNYYTTGHNTLQGLISTANSNPNFVLMTEGNKYYFKNSFIKKLADDGYKTIFLRSASKYFAHEDKIFTALGFQEIIAMEDFVGKEDKYIHSWGLMDRILYKELLKILNEKYKDDKVFILTLGVDTHPLDGRKSFLDLDYPFDNSTFSAYKGSEYFLKSVANLNYDLANLYKEIKKDENYNEKTCFIWTADHACPLNAAVAEIPGYPQTSLARMPLVIDYKWINPKDYMGKLSSQVDLAPTILDIVGIDYPESYWGNSLFSPNKSDISIGYDQERLYIKSRGTRHSINVKKPRNYYEKELVKYFKYIAEK